MNQNRRPIRIVTPGPEGHRHRMSVLPGPKPPKLRFPPRTRLELEGIEYTVVYCYRLAAEPHEWYYSLEEWKPERANDAIAIYARMMGCGDTTPRVVPDTLFRSSSDAMTYFFDIPRNGDGLLISNKKLLQRGVKVLPGLRGEIVPSDTEAKP